jgi:hypothetical protein
MAATAGGWIQREGCTCTATDAGRWCLSILLDVSCSCQLELMWMLQQQRRLGGVCLQLPLRSSTSHGWEETNGGVSRLFVCWMFETVAAVYTKRMLANEVSLCILCRMRCAAVHTCATALVAKNRCRVTLQLLCALKAIESFKVCF